MSAITVSTVAPATIPTGHLPVIVRTRGNPNPANKLRAIVIPEFDLSSLPSKWAAFSMAALSSVAQQRLAALWKDDTSLQSVQPSLFTVDSLLAYAGETNESTRLTGAAILSTLQPFFAAVNPKMRGTAEAILCSMAAPAKKGTVEQLRALAIKLTSFAEANEDSFDDAGLNLATRLVNKLNEHADELERQATELGNDSF